MNEEAPVSEETPGVGAGLRRAREAKGLSTQDVGSRLRLMSRQVEAIEAEEFSKLGPPVFARGFVRNYAKLLGLNPDELLEQMTRVKVTPVQDDVESVPFTPSQGFWTSPLVLAGIAAAFLLIAIPVSLYLWLSSDEEEAAPAVEQMAPPPPPPPAPQLELPPAAPAAVPEATMPPTPAPAPVQQPQAKPVPPPQTPAPATAPQVVRPPLPFQMPAPVAQPAPAPATAPAKTSSLRMQFDESAWVQIRDSSGRMVHSGLNPAGTSVEVNGKAPFFLVVGNADHVRVHYKGQVIDLKPFTAVDVARLTLNP